ncbi:unnamed protein product [Macrosiphum euphorbiae]|uniref:Uncharacterized protein n=1 Tax=Macrosiphum euphorbiae TaxID=13131 RepID=A0AAV0XWU1_9HEMI|nr:unnamed protein product [Macrosiphum euphorbiae]
MAKTTLADWNNDVMNRFAIFGAPVRNSVTAAGGNTGNEQAGTSMAGLWFEKPKGKKYSLLLGFISRHIHLSVSIAFKVLRVFK